MTMIDLLVIGDANPDVIVGPLAEPLEFGQREQLASSGVLTLGGSGAIMACGAARLGLTVAFAGRVGADESGRFVRDSLDAHGVDTSGLITDPGLATPLTVVVTRDDDRAIVTAPGTLSATTTADVPRALLRSCRHVHAASYFLMPALAAQLPALFAEVRSLGHTTSLDTNDDPAGRWQVPGMYSEVDFLLPNAAEAMRLAGADTVEAAAIALAGHGPTVVVKDGAAGALSYDGRNLLRTKGIPVIAVDSVGAGDSFDAGFVAATLAGSTAQRALEIAAICGALSTRGIGGTTTQPTWDEAMATCHGMERIHD
ncbi:carbohydrate kinase family protein [Nocardia sp. NPDC051321]|uniref:carbohydrate kinase family protein n=1 Tax=Nocardia sp. NPDC051321 TaxID=3364323 RepID=UPI0037A6EB4F